MHRAEGIAPIPVPEWWFNKELSGGGALIDLGSHMINLPRLYFGEIKYITSVETKPAQEPDSFCLMPTDYAPGDQAGEVLRTNEASRSNSNIPTFDNGISVVIPTYYRSMDLSGLLDSILKQTKKPTEVIIVDDTPNPSVKLICEQYEKNFREIGVRLFYVKNPKERSISIARNLGARMAKGGIVQFVDSDVILHPDYLGEVQKTFEKHAEALGVAGWVVWNPPTLTGARENALQTVLKLFFLFHYARVSCKLFEIPVFVNKEIRCEWLSGADMAFKHDIFSQFQFDENLKKYSFMENVLFTGLIDKAYPGRLFLTPEAKCYHMDSREGKMEKSELRMHKLRCRKYVMTKLFGYRGLLLFGWQNLGILVVRMISGIRRKDYSPIEA